LRPLTYLGYTKQKKHTEKFEQASSLLHNICEQYCAAFLLYVTVSNIKESRALQYNLQTLHTQLKSVMHLLLIHTKTSMDFYNIIALISDEERHVLHNNCMDHCSSIWKLLSIPTNPTIHHTAICIITLLEIYLSKYVRPFKSKDSHTESEYAQPPHPCKPSIIHQITTTEIATDPYLLSLQKTYCYPLNMTLDEEIDNDTNMEGNPLSLHIVNTRSPWPSTTFTVEESIEVITELIQDLQSADQDSPPPVSNCEIVKPQVPIFF